MSSKVRMQFDFAPIAVTELDRLVDETGAASRAEVIRRALAVFDLMMSYKKTGGKVILQDAEGKETALLII